MEMIGRGIVGECGWYRRLLSERARAVEFDTHFQSSPTPEMIGKPIISIKGYMASIEAYQRQNRNEIQLSDHIREIKWKIDAMRSF
jgi:hypothetical protein